MHRQRARLRVGNRIWRPRSQRSDPCHWRPKRPQNRQRRSWLHDCPPLGHTVTDTFPGLVPLVIEDAHWTRELSGTSAEVELEVRSSTGRVLRRDRGSLLLTHFGLSGPVALDISRHWIAARRSDPGATLAVNFLPGVSLDQMLLDAAAKNPRA